MLRSVCLASHIIIKTRQAHPHTDPSNPSNPPTMAGVIFVKAGLTALTMFTAAETPHKPKHQGDSVVRIAVGLNSHDHSAPSPDDQPWDADGTTPALLAFNELGGYIGGSNWQKRPHIKSGTYTDVTVHQGKGQGQQAPYLQLFAGTDAVCIAYISQLWSDGQLRGWVGDMGTACGMPTYYSHLFVGSDGHAPGKSIFRVSSELRWHSLYCGLNWRAHIKPFFIRLHVARRRPKRCERQQNSSSSPNPYAGKPKLAVSLSLFLQFKIVPISDHTTNPTSSGVYQHDHRLRQRGPLLLLQQ